MLNNPVDKGYNSGDTFILANYNLSAIVFSGNKKVKFLSVAVIVKSHTHIFSHTYFQAFEYGKDVFFNLITSIFLM